MKNSTKSLVPVAALILFGACATGVMAFLVVVATSFGFWGERPFFYFEQYNLPMLSMVLPIAGMLLYGAILFGISGRRKEETTSVVVEGPSNEIINDQGKEAERPLKAA